MFTGLIETVGSVARIEQGSTVARLWANATFTTGDVALGDSIAVNGVCLTVTKISGTTYEFDVSPETVRCTSLQQLTSGSQINLERALRVGDRLGGHLVSGHVDCLATIVERREQSGNWLFRFQLPGQWLRYLVAKGSVTIDGISLTVNELTPDGFTINVIPHTAKQTTLVNRRPGDQVNIETDIIGKYVERLLQPSAPPQADNRLADLLAQSGFI
jgi:riboflavin synthase